MYWGAGSGGGVAPNFNATSILVARSYRLGDSGQITITLVFCLGGCFELWGDWLEDLRSKACGLVRG